MNSSGSGSAGPAPGPAGTKTLWIHIGGIKTGTTTLQQFLSANRTTLKARGFLYPGTGVSHWGITIDLGIRHDWESRHRVSPVLPRILGEMHGASCHSCIISAEDLCERGAASALRTCIPEDYSVKIVYYARRQDELIESWYNQYAKSFLYPHPGKLDRALIGTNWQVFDHADVLQQWAGSFGKENVIVRPFERQQMAGDIIGDFSAVIGLEHDDGFTLPEKMYNRRITPDQLEVIRLCKNRIPGNDAVIIFLEEQFDMSTLVAKKTIQHMLSPSMRRDLLAQYEESNCSVARRYLDREDGRLFFDPWPDPEEPWEPYTGLTLENLIPVAGELLYLQAMNERTAQPLQAILEIANHRLARVVRWFRQGSSLKRPAASGTGPGIQQPACSLTSERSLEALRECRTVDELVVVIVTIIMDRKKKTDGWQPLADILLVFNRLLARGAGLIPVRKRRRLGHQYAERTDGV